MTDEQSAYGRSAPDNPGLKRVRTRHFSRAKEQGIKITGLTSYDFLSATIFDQAGIDFLLVGDSAANTVFGYDSTLPVTVDELIPLTAAVVRGAKRALVVADMPFGSYEDPDDALHTAIRFMKETGCQAVKLEGGVRSAKQIRRIVRAGIPVMAHIGFTPQSEHGLGGHIIQGRGKDGADELMADAKAVEDAGAFAVVVEMTPSTVAGEVTKALQIPTISVGAGPLCDGQLLVWTDWAGFSTGRIPKFVKRFANIGEELRKAAEAFRVEVDEGLYPGPEHEYADTPGQ